MEENSEVRMETDMSSAPGPSGDVQRSTSSNFNVETVVTVENVKEEDMSPKKKTSDPTTQANVDNDPINDTEKSLQKEAPLRKIIIKGANKEYQIVKIVQKTGTKTDDYQNSACKDSQPNIPVKSLSSEGVSFTKIDTQRSPNKDIEKNVPISPIKNTVSQDAVSSKVYSVKEQLLNSKVSPNKEPLPNSKVSPNKEPLPNSNVSPNKESMPNSKVTPNKEVLANSKVSPNKEPLPNSKVTPNKELLANSKVTPNKEPLSNSKVTPNKELLSNSKVTPNKEPISNSKVTPNKEVLAITKVTLNKEPLSNNMISPGKEKSSKVTYTKEQLAKGHFLKEFSVKATLLKELTPKTTQVKEQASKGGPAKEITPKSTAVKELSSKPSRDTSTPEKSNAQRTDTNKAEEISGKFTSNVTAMEIDKEASNDSQLETSSNASEKEHNRSISRELKSLLKSAKESKIISECNQLTNKTRKSRTPLESSNTSLNVSVEPDRIQGIRRGSDNSQKSGCSEKSDKGLKRSMRSQNPEFVHKVKQFLNSVTAKIQKEEGSDEEMEEASLSKSQENLSEPVSSTPKKKKADESLLPEKSEKLRSDLYCWRCHWPTEPAPNEKVSAPTMNCTVCPRSFHYRCLTNPERTKITSEKTWVCLECLLILNAEGSETRSPAMKKITLGMLSELLKYALERMMDINGVEPFVQPVDRTLFPDYDKYIVHPMDLSLMKQNIADSLYGSTEAFIMDAQWILHNSIIFNTLQSKLTSGARALVRSCRAEMGEIEACPECYAAAHARRPTWFTDVCSTPHVLLWAKLKGFPYWPAKGMSVNSSGLVDVRFFGAHDRAWVPAKDCFLFCEKDPNNFRTKRQDILDSMQEAEQHIRNISRKYGKFVYPPFKTQFDPAKLTEQLKMMIPSFEGEVRSHIKEKSASDSPLMKEKRRSHSKSSKSSVNDGDTSEGEDTMAARTRKMADGAEIAREEDDYAIEKEKDKTMEVEVTPVKEKDTSRKRRHSNLEEAVLTIMESSKEKKKRVESVDKPQEEKSDNGKEVKVPDVKETTEPKEQEKSKATETPKQKDSEPSPSTSTVEKKLTAKGAPVRLISIAKVLKNAKVSPRAVNIPVIQKTPQKTKLDKSSSNEKISTPEEPKTQRRRSSKSNKPLNNSNAGKTDRGTDKKSEKTNKEKTKDVNKNAETNNSGSDKSSTDKSTPSSSTTPSPKSSKDRLQFDDNTTLAVLRDTGKPTPTVPGMPTITCVRSLSQSNNEITITKTSVPKSIEITVEASSDSSIFTPTSTDNVRNMKDAVNKLQKLRNDTDVPVVGRVGVRAFARMTSPPPEPRPNELEVEIKSEPMDFDDADRQMEKLDLMNAFKLRPVNGPSNLRDVRINKVVVSSVNNKKVPPKPVEIRPRAKKTFPQPKKPDDGRSELISKNSMVYIPIQPPMTQAPLRPQRPVNANGPGTPPAPRPMAPIITSTSNSIVNTMTTPVMPVSMSTLSSPTPSTSAGTSPVQSVPTVGQVPTTVHTVPLITSVNGQWTFSLQPVMSVGGVDSTPSTSPMLNGLPERTTTTTALVPHPSVVTSTATSAPLTSTAVVPPLATISIGRNNRDDSLPGEMPRLQQRPSLMNPLDANTPVGCVPPPSTAGPLTAKLNQNAVKMTDFFRTLLEDSLEKLDEPAALLTAARLQLEQVAWRHKQQLEEVKHNHELTMAEMRASFEKEKIRLVSETRRATQVELEAAVKLAKTKQWCANCLQEAQFYCCWNTSYCDYPCQRAHWAHHYAVCTQQRAQDGNDSANPPENRLQSLPDNLPKTTAAPNLTVGGKLAARVFSPEQHAANQSKTTSIIMSMVEDNSGNQSLKCVGTYKTQAPAQMTPLLINKQLMNNEEAAKKVVTSGGYLIVGGNPSTGTPTTQPLVTPSRRTHTLQYYT